MEYWLTNLANAATILTGIAVLSAVFPYFQGRRQRRQDADKFYVERYWQIHDRKTPKRRSDGSVYIEIPFDVLFAELMLCEDELEARAAGHVTQISWNRWSQTIRAVLEDPEAAALLDALPASAFDRLRAFRADGADPIRIGRFRQFWRGLL